MNRRRLHAAAYVGIELGQRLTTGGSSSPRGSSGGTPRRRSRAQPRGNAANQPQGAATGATSLEVQLLGKFPEFDPGWSPEIQKQWFDGFKKLMGMADRHPSKESGG